MNELLQKLLEAEVLSEETKTELESAFETKLNEAIEAAKEDAAATVRADLTEQWITERDQLVEAIDSKVSDFLTTEMTELKEDIESFRDLELEYAEKIVEAKASMSDELKTDMTDLVEKIDSFLEIRLNSELQELQEDIAEVRKNQFGRKIFEAYAEEFMADYSDDDSSENTLRETTERLVDVEAQLLESNESLADMTRTLKLEEVLAPLAGRQREVMEAILRNVDTAQLEEGYKTFIGRVLKEAESEKEDEVLADKADDKDADKDDDKKDDKKSDDDDKAADKDDDDLKEGRTGAPKRPGVLEGVDTAEAPAFLNGIRKLAGI